MSRNRLEKFIAELSGLTKDKCPQAMITVSTNSLEGEDASMEIIVPSADAFDAVDEAVLKRSDEIFDDEGYHIVVMVFEQEQVAASQAD